MSQFGPPPSSPNPFQAPQFQPKPAAAPVAATGPFQFEYLRAYNYIFENPNWTMNVLWGFLCLISTQIIPILGQLVFMGYQFEVAEALFVSRGRQYPDFDINRFADYLGRSIWPLLVSLVSAVVIVPLVLVVYIGAIVAVGGGAAAGGDDLGPVLAVAGMLLVMLLGMALWVLFLVVLTPMMIRAGLQQDFAAAFDFGWIKDFVSKTWVEIILSSLFVMFTGWLIAMLGVLALCIGIFAAMAIIFLAQAHIYYQLYALYLSRGGVPFPFKPRYPAAPQGYMPPPGGFQPPPQQF
jgi:hypothetical protein